MIEAASQSLVNRNEHPGQWLVLKKPIELLAYYDPTGLLSSPGPYTYAQSASRISTITVYHGPELPRPISEGTMLMIIYMLLTSHHAVSAIEGLLANWFSSHLSIHFISTLAFLGTILNLFLLVGLSIDTKRTLIDREIFYPVILSHLTRKSHAHEWY